MSVDNFGQYDPSAGRLKDLYGLRDGKIQHIQGQDGAQTIAAQPLATAGCRYRANSFAVNLRGDSGAIVTKGGGSPWSRTPGWRRHEQARQ